MLDLKLIRDQPEAVERALADKGGAHLIHEILDRSVDLLELGVECLHPLGQGAHLHADFFRDAALGFAHFLGDAITLGVEVFDQSDEAAAFGVALEDLADQAAAALVGERPLDRFGLIADQLEVQHGRARRFRRGRRSRPRPARSSPRGRRRRDR